MMTLKKHHDFAGSQACHDYLITGPHGVKDSQLSASSVYGQMPDNHGPDRARLFSDAVYYPNNGTYNRGSWVARDTNQQQYIQVYQPVGVLFLSCLALWTPRLGKRKRELLCVLFVRLLILLSLISVLFLFLLVSGIGCGL